MLTLEEKEKGLASYRNLLIIKFNVQKEKVDEDMPEKKMRL
jgi:predicted metal-binding protein